jgi:hypothetical protein
VHTNLLQDAETHLLAMDVCSNAGLGDQRAPVLHFDFAGPVPENGAQRNEIGVAATFIGLYN